MVERILGPNLELTGQENKCSYQPVMFTMGAAAVFFLAPTMYSHLSLIMWSARGEQRSGTKSWEKCKICGNRQAVCYAPGDHPLPGTRTEIEKTRALIAESAVKSTACTVCLSPWSGCLRCMAQGKNCLMQGVWCGLLKTHLLPLTVGRGIIVCSSTEQDDEDAMSLAAQWGLSKVHLGISWTQ